MKKYFKSVLLVSVLAVLVFGAGSVKAEEPITPPSSSGLSQTITEISPASVKSGGPDVILTVSGMGFTTCSAVALNDSKIKTSYISENKLTAVVPASYIIEGLVFDVTVGVVAKVQACPGDGVSNVKKMVVTGAISGGSCTPQEIWSCPSSRGGGDLKYDSKGKATCQMRNLSIDAVLTADYTTCGTSTVPTSPTGENIPIIVCSCPSTASSSIVNFDTGGNAYCKNLNGSKVAASCTTTSSAYPGNSGTGNAPYITRANGHLVRGDGTPNTVQGYSGDFLDVFGTDFNQNSNLCVNGSPVSKKNYSYSENSCQLYNVQRANINVSLPVNIKGKIPSYFYMFGWYNEFKYYGFWYVYGMDYNTPQLTCSKSGGNLLESYAKIPQGEVSVQVCDTPSSNTVTAGVAIIAGCPHFVTADGKKIFDQATPKAVMRALKDKDIDIWLYSQSAGETATKRPIASIRGAWIYINDKWQWIDGGPNYTPMVQNDKYEISFTKTPMASMGGGGINLRIALKTGFAWDGATGMIVPEKTKGNVETLVFHDLDMLEARFNEAILKYGDVADPNSNFPAPPPRPGTPAPACSEIGAEKYAGCHLDGNILNEKSYDPFAPDKNALKAPSVSRFPVLESTGTLSVGSVGVKVQQLQQTLINLGHPIPDGATGYFGFQTKAAVEAFQKAQGLSPLNANFGKVGPWTIAKINESQPSIIISLPTPSSPISIPTPGVNQEPSPVTPSPILNNVTPITEPILDTKVITELQSQLIEIQKLINTISSTQVLKPNLIDPLAPTPTPTPILDPLSLPLMPITMSTNTSERINLLASLIDKMRELLVMLK